MRNVFAISMAVAGVLFASSATSGAQLADGDHQPGEVRPVDGQRAHDRLLHGALVRNALVDLLGGGRRGRPGGPATGARSRSASRWSGAS